MFAHKNFKVSIQIIEVRSRPFALRPKLLVVQSKRAIQNHKVYVKIVKGSNTARIYSSVESYYKVANGASFLSILIKWLTGLVFLVFFYFNVFLGR